MAGSEIQSQQTLWSEPSAGSARQNAGQPPYYRIGQVAEILGVEPHVIRYWEKEFPQLKPVRAGSRQRLYHAEHVDMLAQIKALLHQERYTIEGARQRLDELIAGEAAAPVEARGEAAPQPVQAAAPGPATSPTLNPALNEIKSELREIIGLLDD